MCLCVVENGSSMLTDSSVKCCCQSQFIPRSLSSPPLRFVPFLYLFADNSDKVLISLPWCGFRFRQHAAIWVVVLRCFQPWWALMWADFLLSHRCSLSNPLCPVTSCTPCDQTLSTEFFPGCRVLARRQVEGFYYLGTITQQVQVEKYWTRIYTQ